MTQPLPTQLAMLGWSVVLFLVHMMLQSATALRDQGVVFNAGPRDHPPPLGVLAGRARRAFDNFKETYPVYIALALALTVAHRGGELAETGAGLWFGARVAYIPLYTFGVPWLRTVAWGVAALGLGMMLVRLLQAGA
jgi:uncharacterized MAPEG superfamily protein